MADKYDFTPIDIRHKEFSTSMFGYSKKEVQEYLKLLATQVEDLIAQKENNFGQERNNIFDDRAQSELLNEQLQKKEELISKTLMQAENTRNDVIRNANKEAENIIKETELAAKQAINETSQYIKQLQDHYINLKEVKRQFLMETHAQIKTFLMRIEQDPLMDNKKESEMDSVFTQASQIKTGSKDATED
ncbi:MAG TPA: DivIVA domain-containing protein [Candidatus Cloacimonadota bacterium]|jgi:DivIVA domain-containing protein|nr:DivIVA domain-containing protein [Candidatus Cloacimonadales bacterium]HPY97058.1 DivIVA domain-containing protein [Candidatus Cloacimonadota bacterium]HQB41614.1 DivIVA domain-containing protein [Candidatus Cloacimonadota bacterium]